MSSQKIMIIAVGGSVLLHATSFVTLEMATQWSKEPAQNNVVRITVAEPPPPPPPPAPPATLPPKPKPKPEPKKAPTQAPRPKPTDKVQQEAVQGIAKEAMVTDGPGLAAPVGNTLLKEDEGKRLDNVAKLDQDCTADARLKRDTVETPKYTEEALDAGLEGVFAVDVYVDERGDVMEAEVRKPIGYGMDVRVIEAARRAKFQPRMNKACKAIAGWAEMKFSLIIP